VVSAGIDVAFPPATPTAPAAPDAAPAPARRAGAFESRDRHYPILDALRFVLAFWVAVGHFGAFPLFAGIDSSTRIGYATLHAWNFTVFGVPSVIVFFVISGFCIHGPFRRGESFSIARYYARRYTRILVPVTFALWIYAASGMEIHWLGEHSVLWQSVLWSLACEEIYYAAYPAIAWLRGRFGWQGLIPCSFVVSVACSAPLWRENEFQAYGPFVTALILLPVWLLGCVLAEQAETLQPKFSARRIWAWRLLAWAGSCACGFLQFKAHVYWPQTMIWFGLLAFFWVREELRYSLNRAPARLLIFGGAWSYSLYLVHVPAMRFYLQLRTPNFGYSVNWLLSFGFVLAFAFLFYRAIERPSHAWARKIHVRARSRQARAEPAEQAESAEPALAERPLSAHEGFTAAGDQARLAVGASASRTTLR
jgi:peptidoglycan/LPS O-acetylase OafA/YrhL